MRVMKEDMLEREGGIIVLKEKVMICVVERKYIYYVYVGNI